MTDSTGGNGQQSLPTLSVGLRTVSALVSRENQELEIPTPPTSPPISTATSNSCPLPRGATISRIASNSVQPSSTTAVGEVIQGLGDGTQKILEAFIKADETEFEVRALQLNYHFTNFLLELERPFTSSRF